MRITRAVAGLLLLLALVLAVRAGKRCANCRLGEGDDPCDCDNNVVRAQKLAKPEIFASPEAIKSALKLRSNYGVTSPSPVSYSLLSNYYRRSKNTLRPTSIAPKFEPIGDLCHTCKGYKDNVVGVVPARPAKVPCKCSKSKAETNPTSTPAPSPVYATSASLPAYSVPAPSYSTPTPSQTVSATVSYSAPIPSYNVPTPSYYSPSAQVHSTSAPFYSGSTVFAQYAPAYQTSASHPSPPASPVAQYASSHPQPAPIIYVAAPLPSATNSYKAHESQCNCGCKDKKTNPTTGYASAHHASLPLMYVAAASSSSSKRSYEDSKSQPGAQYAPAFYLAESSSAKKTYKKAEPQAQVESALAAKRSYGEPKSQCGCKDKQETMYTLATNPAVVQYAPTYEEPAASTKTPNSQSADKDEHEAETYVEIVLEQEQAPKYTADPISISLAYKNLAESQGKPHVAEDSLAYGHYKEPADGRACKHISNFDEEKLHTVDKPVVELKLGKCQNDDSSNVQVSYSDIGYGPVAPSKNRFVPKTDSASNSPYGPTIIYVPPPKDENGILGEPLGPTIPGYQSGGVIVGKSNGKPSCGCGDKTSTVKEGSRRAILVEESGEEPDNDSYNGKGGIIERVKSCACKSGH